MIVGNLPASLTKGTCSPPQPYVTLHTIFVCVMTILYAASRYQKELAAYKAKKAAEGSEEEGSEEESD